MTVQQLKKVILSMQDDTCKIDSEYGIKKSSSHNPWTGDKTQEIKIYFDQGNVTDKCVEIGRLCNENGYGFSPYFKSDMFGYIYYSGWNK